MNCFKYSFYVNLLSLKHNNTVLNLILSFLGAVVKLPTKCERDNPLMEKWSCRLSTCSSAWSYLVAVYFMLDIVILSVFRRTLTFVQNCIFELEAMEKAQVTVVRLQSGLLRKSNCEELEPQTCILHVAAVTIASIWQLMAERLQMCSEKNYYGVNKLDVCTKDIVESFLF